MSWNSNLRKGTDLPTWDWLSMHPDGTSYPGTTITYDGYRYFYVMFQTGTTSQTATSTMTLWKYDTWTDGWHRISGLTSGTSGADMIYDPIRNVLLIQNGGTTTTFQGFNLNVSSTLQNGNTQISGVTLQPYTNTGITPAFTTSNANGSQLAFPENINTNEYFATGTVAQSSSTSYFNDTINGSLINAGHIGTAIKFTSGSNLGQRKIINNVTYTKGRPVARTMSGSANQYTITVDSSASLSVGMTVTGLGIGYNAQVASINVNTLTLNTANIAQVTGNGLFVADFVSVFTSSSFTNIPQNGDAFIVEYPQGTISATNASTSSAILAGDQITPNTNTWRDADILITSGTGQGQRRRIASVSGASVTLASYTAGNSNTGSWTTNPDTTSTYEIIPSSDFIYNATANSSSLFYRLDLNTNTAAVAAWSALATTPATFGNGHQLFYGRKLAPFSIFAMRGGGNRQMYRYDIGLNTWTEISPALGSGNAFIGTSDTFTSGAHACGLWDYNRLALHFGNSTRLYAMRLSDGFIEPLGTIPYAAGSAYDGSRMRNIKSIDGVNWLYFQRPGGGEFFRLALEHLP
jgi:hypothetical protein